MLSVLAFSACGNAKNDYQKISDGIAKQQQSLDDWATQSLNSGNFDDGVAVLKAYSDQGEFTSKLAAQISEKLRKQAEEEYKKGNLAKAYDMAKKIFQGMALQENIGLLAKIAKDYSQKSFENKDYSTTIDAAYMILQLHWDEDAMGLKLAAEFELLKQKITANDLKTAQHYYDDIMDITSLKGNENLAKKYRAETQAYSNKFPNSKFK